LVLDGEAWRKAAGRAVSERLDWNGLLEARADELRKLNSNPLTLSLRDSLAVSPAEIESFQKRLRGLP
jgi:hypothetical protein